MTTPNEETSSVPEEVSKAAEMATELHARLFPVETPAEDPAQAGPANADPAPASAEEPAADPAPEVADPEPAEDYVQKYKVLQGKYSAEVPKMAARIRELEQNLSQVQAAPKVDDKPATPNAIDEIMNRLKESYPEDLIEDLLAIQRLQSEQLVDSKVKPLEDQALSAEEAQLQARQSAHVALIAAKAPNWQEVWNVACELDADVPPSDSKIAEFLNSPDPSGLYTNRQLLDMYSENWDAERFAIICNMYKAPPAPNTNPGKDALLAPSRQSSQPVPQSQEQKIWTMAEIEQFQRDRRMGKVEDADASVIWTDIQKALAENRIR